MTAAPVRLDGRVAVVTGAGRGLGRSYALRLASRGACVVVNDTGSAPDGTGRSPDPAQQVVAEIQAAGGRALADAHTVATPGGGEAIVGAALDTFGKVDAVVCNAGVVRDASFRKATPHLFDPVVDVHLRGAVHVTRAAWHHMREQGYGRVVMTTSASGLYGGLGHAAYGAAKMGVVGLTRVLALEGADHGINVNAVAPLAATRLTEGVFGRYASRFAPDLVAPVVVWLAAEACSVSGQIYTVGGGRVARVFIAETAGYFSGRLDVEEVGEHLAEIHAEDGYGVPGSVTDAIRAAVAHLRQGDRSGAG